jgi:Zn-dependent metalloprotease
MDADGPSSRAPLFEPELSPEASRWCDLGREGSTPDATSLAGPQLHRSADIFEHLNRSKDPALSKLAFDNARWAAAARAMRVTLSMMPSMAAIPSPSQSKDRLIYDMRQNRFPLPGTLTRSEGDGPGADPAINEAYDYSGLTYDFYREFFARNSLDNHGMSMLSSVHYGRNVVNAFWDGQQMLYGDGDGQFFGRFTASIDVVGHELTHGVVMHESNLDYQDEPGALNEHFADVFGSLIKQWHLGQAVDKADWLIGAI